MACWERGLCGFRPAKRNSPSGSCEMIARARSLSGTRCSRPDFIRSPGTVQRPLSRSISDQRALIASPVRAAVRIVNSSGSSRRSRLSPKIHHEFGHCRVRDRLMMTASQLGARLDDDDGLRLLNLAVKRLRPIGAGVMPVDLSMSGNVISTPGLRANLHACSRLAVPPRPPGPEIEVVERARDFERAEHPERDVELAAGRLRVEMAAHHHGCEPCRARRGGARTLSPMSSTLTVQPAASHQLRKSWRAGRSRSVASGACTRVSGLRRS